MMIGAAGTLRPRPGGSPADAGPTLRELDDLCWKSGTGAVLAKMIRWRSGGVGARCAGVLEAAAEAAGRPPTTQDAMRGDVTRTRTLDHS